MDAFSGKEAARLSGFQTVAMLDYLQRSGVFEPGGVMGRRGRGCGRNYTFRDLLVLKAFKRLLDSGGSLASMREPLQRFQRRKWLATISTIEDKDGPIRFMLANAGQIELLQNVEQLADRGRQGHLTFSYVIDLANLHEELREALGLKVVSQFELPIGSH